MNGLSWVSSSLVILFLLVLLAKTLFDKRSLAARVAKSEASYKSITTSETVGILFASLKGPLLDANDAFLKIIGYSREELEQGTLTWGDITPPGYEEIDRQKVEELFRTGSTTAYEKQFIHKDGHLVDVWLGDMSLMEGSEDIVTGCLLNITERKNIERSLQESEARFSRVIEGSNDGYWDWDLERGQVFWSDRLFAMLGETPTDNFVPFGIFETHLPSSDEARFSEAIQASIKLGIPLHIEFQMRHQQGYYIDCLSRGKPYYNEKGEVIRLAGMLSDVTEQKRMQDALLKSEARFRQLADSNLLGVAFWNIYGKIYEANDTFLNILGYGREDVETGLLNWQILTLPEDQRAHAERVQKAIQGATVLPYETRFIHKEGHKIDALVGYAMLEGSKEQGFVFVLDISERKQAEQALRDSEQRFRFMAEAMPQMVWTAVPDGSVDYLNSQWMDYTGQPLARLMHWGWIDVVHPEDREALLDVWHALISEEVTEMQTEYRLRRADGEYRWHLGRALPMRNGGGRILLWLGTSTDIEDLKRTQAYLAESEHRFRVMADASPLQIWVLDDQGSLIYCNNRAQIFHAMSLDTLLALDWQSLLHPEFRQVVVEMVQAAYRDKAPFETEVLVRRFDGEYRWLYVVGSPWFDAEGNFAGIVSSALDIHDRKLMEQALREREERYRLLSHATNDTMWDWNLLTDEVEWNEQFFSVFHYKPEQVEHTSEWWLKHIHPEDRDRITASVQSLFEQGGDTWTGEYRYLCADGVTSKTVLDRGFLIHDEQGKPIRMLGSMLDLTKQKQYEQRVRTIAESMPNKMWIALPTGEIEYVNQRWVDYTGIQAQTLQGFDSSQLIYPEDLEIISQAWHLCILNKKNLEAQVRLKRYDGMYRWHLVQGIPLLDSKGDIEQIVGSLTDIQEMKEIQSSLEESERRFRVMAEAMPQKVWTTLSHGEMNYMNQNWFDYTGRDWESLKEFQWLEIVHPEDQADTIRLWHESLETKQESQLAHRLRRFDGEYRWHLSRGVPSWNEEGQVVLWVGTSTDIDDLKQVQASLMESEERFRSLADSVPFLIWLSDAHGQNTYTNKTCSDFTGGNQEMLANQDWLAFIHPEDRDTIIQAMMNAIEHQESYHYQYRALRHDGQYRWMQVVGLPRFTSAGKLTGYVGSAFDITEQKEINQILETRIQERTQQLQKSNSLLASIVENVPAMVFLKDAQSLRFELFNKAGKELIGFTDVQLLGKNDYDFFPKEQAEFFIAKDRETLQRGMLVDVPEEPLQTMHGDLRYLHTKKVPIMDEQGNPAYLLGISEDITELKKSQEQVHSLNCQLEDQIRNLNAVNKELESFSYSVSHDLRAPLRTIDGFSQAVLEDYGDQLDEEGKRYLMRVREGSQQMAQLIDDMLNLSRLTRGILKKETFSLSEMVRDIATDLQANNPERQVLFVIQEGLQVEADKRLIQAVMENLIGNAWKFTSHHATALIEFGGALEKDRMVYFVKDDGAGFDMAYVDKLFGTFQRLHNTTEFKGTGVGLASVQRVIHRHGGEIWAQAEVEKGATFYFTL